MDESGEVEVLMERMKQLQECRDEEEASQEEMATRFEREKTESMLVATAGTDQEKFWCLNGTTTLVRGFLWGKYDDPGAFSPQETRSACHPETSPGTSRTPLTATRTSPGGASTCPPSECR